MRKLGIDDFEAFVAKTQSDIEWFWAAAIEDLGIDFFEPYDRILDVSEGPQWPRWFVGGTINLTHNCVDRHARSDLAGRAGDHLGGRGRRDAAR